MFHADLPRKKFEPAGARRNGTHPRLLRVERLETRVLLTLQGNSLFPADNPWNEKITSAPVAANSATLVMSVGLSSGLHPDFGTVFDGALNGIPYNVVSGTQTKINVVLDAYADESDPAMVPIPDGAVIEGDPQTSSQNTTDRHLIVYDKDNNIAYELFNVHRPAEELTDHQWHADSEAVWDMSKDSFRPPGFTSADAAGLPILPGLIRPDEVLDQGVINHALRFTVARSDDAYVFPASHEAGSNNSGLPRMGERFRLKQSFDISGFSAANRVILQALKDFGMIVADNGSNWFLSGEPSARWSDDDLHALGSVKGSNFEVVNLSPIVAGLDQTSGSNGGGTAVTIHGQDFSGAAGQLQVFFGATLAAHVDVISDTVVVATSPAHAVGTVDITVQTPYGTSTTSASDQFAFTSAVSSPPVVSLAATGNYTTSWFNSGPVPIANMVQATVTDPAGLANIASMTVKLATFHTGDVLAVPILPGIAAITTTYSGGTLILSGSDTLANYQKELRFVNYNNTSGGPGTSPVLVTFTASDGSLSSTSVTATVNIKVASGQVLGNRLFYNNSKYDNNNTAIGASDDLAIASDKAGYNGAGLSSFSAVSGFSRGITGIMVDLASGIGTHSNINLTSGDVTFKISPVTFVTTTYNQLNAWTTAPTPANISVRLGAGTSGSDRLEITWANAKLTNTWLEVDVKANAHTGLTADDVFYFASVIGNSGVGDTTALSKDDASDFTATNNNIVGVTTPVWNVMDYTKDQKVDSNDGTVNTNNVFTLHYISNPTGPFAPDAGPSASPAASASSAAAVASGLSLSSSLPTARPPWLSGRPHNILDRQGVAKFPQNLKHPSSSQIQQAIDQVAEKLLLNEDLLDGLLADLRLE